MTKYEGWVTLAKGLSKEDMELLAKACCTAWWQTGPQTKTYAVNRAIRAIEEAFASEDGK